MTDVSEGMMNMAPDDAAQILMALGKREQRGAVRHHHAVHPTTAHRHRLIMQADKGWAHLVLGQVPIETVRDALLQAAAFLAGNGGDVRCET